MFLHGGLHRIRKACWSVFAGVVFMIHRMKSTWAAVAFTTIVTGDERVRTTIEICHSTWALDALLATGRENFTTPARLALRSTRPVPGKRLKRARLALFDPGQVGERVLLTILTLCIAGVVNALLVRVAGAVLARSARYALGSVRITLGCLSSTAHLTVVVGLAQSNGEDAIIRSISVVAAGSCSITRHP